MKQEKIDNIVKSTNFNEVKLQETQNGFIEASNGVFFRKGKKNQWKKELNEKQIARLENKFRDFMNKFGYD